MNETCVMRSMSSHGITKKTSKHIKASNVVLFFEKQDTVKSDKNQNICLSIACKINSQMSPVLAWIRGDYEIHVP